MVQFRQVDPQRCTFTLLPNCALGWKWMKRLFFLLACCIGGVTLYFVTLGAWLVIPFSGLEILVLGVGVYVNGCRCAQREIIDFQGSQLRVWRGGRTLREVECLPRYWTRLTLWRDPRGWYPSRLWLECHGRRVEVGATLVEWERMDLAEDLRGQLDFRPITRFTEPDPLPAGLDAASQEI
jgi:uncharacterized membrane protein